MKYCQMGIKYEPFVGVRHCEEPAVAYWDFGSGKPFYVCEEHDEETLDDMKDLCYDPSRTMRTSLEEAQDD